MRADMLPSIIGVVGIIAFFVIVVAIIVTSKGKGCTKRLLGFLIPVCIVSFIGFGVTRAIFGRSSSHTTSYVEHSGENWIFSNVVNADDSWEVVNEFPNINLNCAGATTIVKQNDGDRIQISADVPDGREMFVGAYYNTDDLIIEVRPNNVTFMDFVEDFGKVLWSDDVFSYPDGVTVTISFPKTIYDQLNVQLGSGKLYIDELYARIDDINIGSGTLEMRRSEIFNSDHLTLQIGSGTVKMENIKPIYYYLNVGSGKYELTGLTGEGSVEMGSGKGSIAFTNEQKHCEVAIGSGKLDMYIAEGGANITSEIGSGAVDVNAYGVDEKLKGDDDVVIGNGSAEISISMGSGKVSIMESANAPEIEFNIPEVPNVSKAVSSSSSSEEVIPSVSEVPAA